MVERAIRLEGTCTGEHGVGVGKIEYLDEELGKGTVNLMETVKRTRESSVPPLVFLLLTMGGDPNEMGRNITNAMTVDPLNLLNPGKVSRHIRAYADCSAVPPYQAYCSHGRAGRSVLPSPKKQKPRRKRHQLQTQRLEGYPCCLLVSV